MVLLSHFKTSAVTLQITCTKFSSVDTGLTLHGFSYIFMQKHKTNEEVLEMVVTEREMMDTLRSRQKRWLGHNSRHDSLLRITLEGRMQGKIGCGRPRAMFLDWLLKTEQDNISYDELKMLAQDRSSQ